MMTEAKNLKSILFQSEISFEQEIVEHSACHGKMNMDMADKILKNKPAFSYVLRLLEVPDTYVLSYVKKDSVIEHIVFRRKRSSCQWQYSNGFEHLCNTLSELVCKAMHCKPEECKPVFPDQKGAVWSDFHRS